jgi:hypothetical protein
MSLTITQIENELTRLSSSESYRRDQKVWAEEVQMKNMKRLAAKARSLAHKDALNFVRVVADSASLTSEILILAERLVKETELGGR